MVGFLSASLTVQRQELTAHSARRLLLLAQCRHTLTRSTPVSSRLICTALNPLRLVAILAVEGGRLHSRVGSDSRKCGKLHYQKFGRVCDKRLRKEDN